jgi:hypothetical protein
VDEMTPDEKIDLLYERITALEEEVSELWSKLREQEEHEQKRQEQNQKIEPFSGRDFPYFPEIYLEIA